MCSVILPGTLWSTTRQLTLNTEFKPLSISALPRRTLLTPSSPPLPSGNVDGMRTSAAEIRDHAAATLSSETQQRLEQFLTPASVADQAASLFTPAHQPVRILDLGSGTGILAAVVAERSTDGSSVVAVEQDASLAADSERTLSQGAITRRSSTHRCSKPCSTRCSTVSFSIPRTRKSAQSASPQARATSR